MVASIIGLKLRSMWNNATHPAWRLVAILFAAIYFGALLVFLLVSSIILLEPELLQVFVVFAVLVSTLITLSWILVPMLGFGLDSSTSPESFSPYLPPSRSLSRAFLIASLVGPAGVATLFVFVTGIVGLFKVGLNVEGIISIVLLPAIMASLVLISRFVTTWFTARVSRSKRNQDIAQIIGALIFVGVTWGFSLVMSNISDIGMLSRFDGLVSIAKWTPLPGIASFPYLLGAGETLPAILQLVYGVVIIVVLGLAWHGLVVKQMIGIKNPITPQARQAIEAGRHLVNPELEVTNVTEERGLESELKTLGTWQKLGFGPAGAAIAARTLRDWVRDARLFPSFIIALMLPVLGLLFTQIQTDPEMATSWVFLYVFAPLVLGQTAGMLVSYDSTAFWMEVSAGVSGLTDRLARACASLPALVLAGIVNGVLASFVVQTSFSTLALVTASIALGLLTTAIMSAVTGYRTFGAQPPGTSAMSTKGTANMMATMVGTLVVFLAAALFMIPSVLGYIYLAPIFSEVAVSVIVLVWAGGIGYVFLLIGGRIFERNQAQILQQIKSWPGH